MIDKTVLHWVEVDVIHVAGIIPRVADRVFPKTPLPDAALAAPAPDRRARFGGRQRPGERLLQFAPAAGKIAVIGGSVQMQCM